MVLWGANYDDMLTYPPYFEKEIVPWLRRVSEELGARRMIVATHTDGENQGLMDLIRDCGCHVAESVTPYPMTKVGIEEYYRRWREKLTIMGGIPESVLMEETATEREFEAYLDLFPRSDHETMARIRTPNLSFKYYKAVTEGIESARVWGRELVSLLLEELPYPELVAEMADFFVRAQGVHISFCAGLFGDDLYLSLRVDRKGLNAGALIEDIAQRLPPYSRAAVSKPLTSSVRHRASRSMPEVKSDVSSQERSEG